MNVRTDKMRVTPNRARSKNRRNLTVPLCPGEPTDSANGTTSPIPSKAPAIIPKKIGAPVKSNHVIDMVLVCVCVSGAGNNAEALSMDGPPTR